MQLSKDSLRKLFANADDVVAEVVNAWIDGLNKLQFPFGASMLFRARKIIICNIGEKMWIFSWKIFFSFIKLADSPGSDCENWSSFSGTNFFLKKKSFFRKSLKS